MTEDEAKTKWCPFARTYTGCGPSNRGPQGELDDNALCVASECMAWRDHFTRTESGAIVFENRGFGYCGLAGRQ